VKIFFTDSITKPLLTFKSPP